MALKDILVYLDATQDSVARLRTAVTLAAKHQARLIGVDISTKDAYKGDSRQAAVAIEGDFLAAVEHNKLEFAFHAVSTDARNAEQFFCYSADLLISTQPHPDRLHLANPKVPKCLSKNDADGTGLSEGRQSDSLYFATNTERSNGLDTLHPASP